MKSRIRRPVSIPTAEKLRNASLLYLGRYAASESSLRRVLMRRVQKARHAHPAFAADAALQQKLMLAIDDIVTSHKNSGVLNDAALADMKVASLRRTGRSERFIRQKLQTKGIARDLVAGAIAAHDEDREGSAEIEAARAYAKRRRLGPFRTRAADDASKKKDFATMARAGYGISVIRQILQTSLDELEMGEF